MPGITGKDQVLSTYADKLAALDAPKGRSLTQDALRRLARNKAAVLSIGVLVLIVLVAFIGPYFVPWGYSEVDWSNIRKPPNFEAEHYLGTDQNGRDMLARVLQGTQMSLIVAAVARLGYDGRIQGRNRAMRARAAVDASFYACRRGNPRFFRLAIVRVSVFFCSEGNQRGAGVESGYRFAGLAP